MISNSIFVLVPEETRKKHKHSLKVLIYRELTQISNKHKKIHQPLATYVALSSGIHMFRFIVDFEFAFVGRNVSAHITNHLIDFGVIHFDVPDKVNASQLFFAMWTWYSKMFFRFMFIQLCRRFETLHTIMCVAFKWMHIMYLFHMVLKLGTG